jgi:hypothetical protein
LSESTIDELYAVIFVMDLAEIVETLDELAATLRQEMLAELQIRNIDESG